MKRLLALSPIGRLRRQKQIHCERERHPTLPESRRETHWLSLPWRVLRAKYLKNGLGYSSPMMNVWQTARSMTRKWLNYVPQSLRYLRTASFSILGIKHIASSLNRS